MKRIAWITCISWLVGLSCLQAQPEPLLLYRAEQDSACRAWVSQKMDQLSLKEKVGQLFIYTIAPYTTKSNMDLLEKVVDTYKVGGLLFSGGELRDQALLTNYAQERADIPLMITFDGEWGLAMRLKGMPDFPKNMALGCIQDNQLVYDYGREVARQCRELGVHVNFAPVADVNINPDNPVINYRSFGENPVRVAAKVLAYSRGLEDGGVLPVAKHFPGHGDTDVDSHHALPSLPFSRERLDSVELFPFRQVIRSGLGSIMAGHLQVPALDPSGLPASLSEPIVTGLLRDELQFKGLVFTDALVMNGVSGYDDLCVRALKAGNDLLLVPRNAGAELDKVMDALARGELSEGMINEKCRKVLAYKYALGAGRVQKINLSGLEERICTPQAEQLIQELHAASITIPADSARLLPMHFSSDTLTLISIGGSLKAHSALVEEMRKYVPVRELRLTAETGARTRMDWLARLAGRRNVVVAVSTPKIKSFGPFLAALSKRTDAVYALFTSFVRVDCPLSSFVGGGTVVLAHSAEEDVQRRVAEVLFGVAPANGRLPASIPGLYEEGEGVDITSTTARHYTPEELGMDGEILSGIDRIAKEGIEARAYPGCRVYALRHGKVLYDKSFGSFTYEKGSRKVGADDLYDLASLSKMAGTLLAVMKLYDGGKLNLSDCASQYLPFLRGTDKEKVTIRELLYHQSGLPSFLPFYEDAIDKESYEGPFFKYNQKDATHQTRIGRNAYASSVFRFKKEWVSSHSSEVYSLPVADSLWLNPAFEQEEWRKIVETPLKSKSYRYSCINFILLKEIVEQISGEGMDCLLEREFFEPMGLNHLLYLPLRRYPKERIVPTVRNDYLRRACPVLQGYVHDEAAAFFGGISGNAGLFGTAADVAAVCQMLLDGGMYHGRRYLSEATCQLFAASTSSISRRGLGFDRPDPDNVKRSPCAPSAPKEVFGHTGFTGTCAWIDPKNDLVYVFLCNRTYPDVWNNKLSRMDIRTRIQEVFYEAML